MKFLLSLFLILVLNYPITAADKLKEWHNEGYVIVPFFETDSFIQLLKVKNRDMEAKYLQWCYDQWKDEELQYIPWYPHYYSYICDILHIPDTRSGALKWKK